MTVLVSPRELTARRIIAAGPLAPLAESLASDLTVVRDRELFVPTEKALLSREGGRCARDASLLEFDPFEPHAHRCPVCGTIYSGEMHDRSWLYWYQLWLAERAVHAALLSALDVDSSFRSLAESILSAYADSYEQYPNRDNVLGPSRLFFSTYLESIWLLQICVAVDLLDASHSTVTSRVRERVVEPARAIIQRFDETSSNRQVWNDAALLAASRLLDDTAGAERAVFGPSGAASHLATGLLQDGTWYEGENYHLFAHRGLWYSIAMAHNAGLEIEPSLLDRFRLGFATPFITALPDLTFPSRRDSQYAVSLRQWRIAEHVELGVAMSDDPLLAGALERLYRDDIPRRETNRWRSSADAERNGPATALTRADLSWRALLFARAELPELVPLAPGSALLGAQGLAVFRRESGRTYVALDYGTSGGGHGHPDRLNLLLVDGEHRWLDDYGTGSYVDPSLHWYRSSLAHNAPSLNGISQHRVNGSLRAYDERGDIGWIVASADGIGPDAQATRTLVVMPEYVIDELSWESLDDSTLELPVHTDVAFEAGVSEMESGDLTGGPALEDGYGFVHDTSVQYAGADEMAHGVARDASDDSLELWVRATHDVEWWRAVAPGPPGAADRAFRLARVRARSGNIALVWSWARAVTSVAMGEAMHLRLADGSTHTHSRTADGWRVIVRSAAGDQRVTDLSGIVGAEALIVQEIDLPGENRSSIRLAPSATWQVTLGEAHYRTSEQTWEEAARPTAHITLTRDETTLRLTIDVPNSDRTFVPPDAVNPLDNELPDVNGDSVQLYVETVSGRVGRMLVPDGESSAVRVRAIEGWTAQLELSAQWAATATGYRMEIVMHAEVHALDLIVNERPLGRDRRRGQLVLSGAAGEFVYLRGDRHEYTRLIRLDFTDD